MHELVTAPTVIAIDPGGTTGWSVMVVHPEALTDPDVPILANIEHWSNGQIGARPELLGAKNPSARELQAEERRCVKTLMRDVFLRWPGAAVVIEDFILRKMSKSRDLLSPVRLTSALEYALMDEELEVTFHKQTPSQAKGTATDDRMKQWGLYKRAGGMQHARDADRHSITFLRSCKSKGGMRHLAWPHLYLPSGDLRPGVLAGV